MKENSIKQHFRFWSVVTVVSIYLLILVGGIVRATGSGMGCPDWPRCFGQWVPPTNVSELPANYKQVYTAQRVAKNQELARTLASLGFKEVAGNIFAHPTQYIETDFNATKTWIEYINRLLGVLIGIFVFVTAVSAWSYRRRDPVIVWLAVASWLLTGIQGWLGSLVVSTNLLPIMVTIHMGLALVIVAILLYAVHRTADSNEATGLVPFKPNTATVANSRVNLFIWGALALTFVQIILGTQVREQVDRVASAAGYIGRESWIEKLDSVFETHRTLSAIVVLINVYMGYQLWQLGQRRIQWLVEAVGAILALEILAGISLAYFALPAFIQPIHLTLATLLFGAQFIMLLAVRKLTAISMIKATSLAEVLSR